MSFDSSWSTLRGQLIYEHSSTHYPSPPPLLLHALLLPREVLKLRGALVRVAEVVHVCRFEVTLQVLNCTGGHCRFERGFANPTRQCNNGRTNTCTPIKSDSKHVDIFQVLVADLLPLLFVLLLTFRLPLMFLNLQGATDRQFKQVTMIPTSPTHNYRKAHEGAQRQFFLRTSTAAMMSRSSVFSSVC